MQSKEIEDVPSADRNIHEKTNTPTTTASSGQLTKQQLKELMADKIKNDSNKKNIDDSNESDSKTSKILNPSKKQKKVTIADEKNY